MSDERFAIRNSQFAIRNSLDLYGASSRGLLAGQSRDTSGALRDLNRFEVLSLARQLARECYRLVATLPKAEQYGLTSQIQRAAVSTAANIAEGLGRGTQGDFERSLRIAMGSAAELDVLTDLASSIYELPAMPLSKVREGTDELRRKLNRLVTQVSRARLDPAASRRPISG